MFSVDLGLGGWRGSRFVVELLLTVIGRERFHLCCGLFTHSFWEWVAIFGVAAVLLPIFSTYCCHDALHFGCNLWTCNFFRERQDCSKKV